MTTTDQSAGTAPVRQAPPATETANPPADERFDTPTVATISGAHLIHDTYPAFLAPLLPLLMERHGFSLAVAGALVSIQRSASILQPLLGYWADRTDARFMVVLTPTVTALGMSLLGLAPNYLALVVLVLLSGISTAAFHPAAGAMITRASGRTWGRGTSLFMTGGELGRALGPLLIAAVVAAVGLEHSYIAIIPGILASLALHWRLNKVAPAAVKMVQRSALWAAIKLQKRTLLLLTGLTIFRALGTTSFVVFYPTYLMQSGHSLAIAAAALTIFELAGAAGALLGGTVSDRFGRRTVMVLTQLVGAPLLFMAVVTSGELWNVVFLILAGIFALALAPVQLALIQEILPENRSVATGILLFLGFEGAVVATLLFGIVAEQIGLYQALTGAIFVSLLSIPFALAIPETRTRRSAH